MIFRCLALAAMIGCGVPDVEAPEFSPRELATGLRFERLARVDNPTYGVVPVAEGPGAWVARGGIIERLDGFEGQVIDTFQLRQGPVEDLELLDRDGDSWLIRVGEEILVVDAQGEVVERSSVEAGCVRIEFEGCLTMEVEDRIAVDRQSQFAVVSGSKEVRRFVEGADRGTFLVDRPLIDVAARAGRLVVLSEDSVMMQLDPNTGVVLAEWKVHRPVDIFGIQLSDDGMGIVLEAPGGIVFFALDVEQPGYLLATGGGNFGSPGGSGGSGGSGSGGGGGGGAGSAGTATNP